MTVPFVAVHAGAGNHSKDTLQELNKLCAEACRESIDMLRKGSDAITAITLAVTILENSPLTNAGLGSCLTLEGSVECDASVMRGDGACGIIGAVSGVKNPVQLAQTLLTEQCKGLLSLGRIPPMCMCGTGAKSWARSHGVGVCDPDDLISDCSKEIYLDHMCRLDNASKDFTEPPVKKPAYEKQQLDTVGAVCIDSNGTVAACCSSGGISLKHPGRIGQAGMYGCGCWAQGNPGCDRVAVSTSGIGETLIKTSLAKEMSASVLSDNFMSVKTSFQDVYMNSPLLDESLPKLAGTIILNVLTSGLAELSWAHSTEEMLVGYMSAKDCTPKVILSNGINETQQDKNIYLCVGGVSLKLCAK